VRQGNQGATGEAAAPQPRVLRDNEGFLGWHLALILLLPMVLLAILSVRRARSRKLTLVQFHDNTFAQEVLHSELPVLVHFFRAWSIADQVVIAQTEILARNNQGRLRVGWMDLDRSPETSRYLEPLESPAVVLFLQGRKIYQRGGLFQEADLQKDLERVLAAAKGNGWRRLAADEKRD
jgi:thioredoxin 1